MTYNLYWKFYYHTATRILYEIKTAGYRHILTKIN